ncbi:MAG TPA: hypothetical protein VGE01_10175, partial [Fimbriimonas sp.]
HDYLGLYEALIRERREAGYPPFKRLVNVLLSGEKRTSVMEASHEAASRLEGGPWELLGPTDCAVERLQNRWRRHLLLKLPPDESARPVQIRLLGFNPKGVQVAVDVDPYTLL